MLCENSDALAGDQAFALRGAHFQVTLHVDCILVLPDRETEHSRLALHEEAAGKDVQQHVEAVELQPAQLPPPADVSLATSLAPLKVAGAPGTEVKPAKLSLHAAYTCHHTCKQDV